MRASEERWSWREGSLAVRKAKVGMGRREVSVRGRRDRKARIWCGVLYVLDC